MTRVEALVFLFVAVAMLVVAATWLYGPYGLGGSGVVLLAIALFVVDVRRE